MSFSPVVGLGLNPRWPQVYVYFGDDIYLSHEMGEAMIIGYQGNNSDVIDQYHVSACAKNYLGYSNPFSGQGTTRTLIPNKCFKEDHLTSIQLVVEKKIEGVMVNSRIVNGLPTHLNKYLLNELLKNELFFDGLVVTD
jgi:beta-glucosidase